MLKKYYNRITHRDEDKKKDAGDKGLIGVFGLPWSTLDWWGLLLHFSPPLLFLSGGVDLGIAALCGRIFFTFVRLVVENCTNCLLASGIVGGGVEQLVVVGGTASRKFEH